MLNKNSDTIKKLSIMMNTGASAQQIAILVMEDMVLRDAVKAIFLMDINDQCKKLCRKSDDGSSVLRVPRSKHKVSIKLYFSLICKQLINLIRLKRNSG